MPGPGHARLGGQAGEPFGVQQAGFDQGGETGVAGQQPDPVTRGLQGPAQRGDVVRDLPVNCARRYGWPGPLGQVGTGDGAAVIDQQHRQEARAALPAEGQLDLPVPDLQAAEQPDVQSGTQGDRALDRAIFGTVHVKSLDVGQMPSQASRGLRALWSVR